MSTNIFDPNKIESDLAESSLQNGPNTNFDGSKTATESTAPKQLTLQFSNQGASLQLQTQGEINASVDFVKFGEPMPGQLSIPLTPTLRAPQQTPLLVSKSYDHILNDPVMNKLVEEYEALSDEEKRLHDLILDKKIRNNFRKKSTRNININLNLAIRSNNIKSFEFQSYLEQVTKQLEFEGLWREELFESIESDTFAIDDLRDDDLDENFDPKELHVIYNPKNMSTQKDSLQELKEEGLEWRDELSIYSNDLPEFTTPTIHNLLRRAPWGLYEVIARKLIDGSFFSNNPQFEELYPCAYFVSKSIFSREIFIQVKKEAFARTPLQKLFRTYPYHQFLKDQKLLEKLTQDLLKKYFHQNPFVRDNIQKILGIDAEDNRTVEMQLNSIWQRYFKTIKTLTKKQKDALNLIYTAEPTLTYEAAALEQKISKDSFQDRVRGAIKKIKQAMPELDNLAQPKTYFKSKERRLLYNGLFDKDSAKKIHPLYIVDPKTNARVEIPARSGSPVIPPAAPGKASVRAWAIAATPIPDFKDTDFYLGLVPEGHIRRKNGKSKFRG